MVMYSMRATSQIKPYYVPTHAKIVGEKAVAVTCFDGSVWTHHFRGNTVEATRPEGNGGLFCWYDVDIATGNIIFR